jgi:hypothetical protein
VHFEWTQVLLLTNSATCQKLKKLSVDFFFDHAAMVVEAETGSDEQAKYKANAPACRRLWAFAKKYGKLDFSLTT